MPADVQKGMGDYKYSTELDFLGYHPENLYDVSQLEAAVSLIEHAERPVIFAGGGVIRSGASELLIDFALKYEIPVTTTLLGKGAFPESHPSGLAPVSYTHLDVYKRQRGRRSTRHHWR